VEMTHETYSPLSPKELANFDNPLRLPGDGGVMGVLDASDAPMRLVARREEAEVLPGKGTALLVYRAERGGREYLNPLFRVRKGTRFVADFENGLDEETTIHWHGLRLHWRMDGHPLNSVRPGEGYRYEFPVLNGGGTYWYHPHGHENTARQTYRGLAGFFLVEDENEERFREALGLRFGENDVPLVIQDRTFDEAGNLLYEPDALARFMGVTGDTVLVNLTPTPYLEVAAAPLRFRLLNGSNARVYRLAFSREDASSLPYTVVAADGVLLDRPREVSELFLAPGERADVLVDLGALDAGEVVSLKSLHFDPMHNEHALEGGMDHADHHMGPARLGDGDEFHVLRLNVAAAGRSGTRSSAGSVPLPAAPEVPAWAEDHDREPDRVFTLSADMGEGEDAGELMAGLGTYTCPMHPEVVRREAGSCPLCGMTLVPGEGGHSMRWLINGRTYGVDEFPVEVRRGAAEVWEFRNEQKSMPHPMHLHGFHYRVLSRTGSPEQVARLAVDGRGRVPTDLGQKDTVLVWPGETVRIFADFSHGFDGDQLLLLHCHVLEHEDTGMMLNVRVS